MASPVTMPQMGFDMQEGRIVRWLKAPGDLVRRGEALAEIETDKATVELEAFEGGRLLQLLVEEGATVPVGTPVALVETEAGTGSPTPTAAGSGAAASPGTSPSDAPPSDPNRPADLPRREDRAADGTEADRRASPVARRVARERGIDLGRVRGTGPGGRILGRDVAETPSTAAPDGREPDSGRAPAGTEAVGRPDDGNGSYRFEPPYHDPADYLDAPGRPPAAHVSGPSPGRPPLAAAPSTHGSGGAEGAPAEVEPWTRMRLAIARRMALAKREIPHFYETIRVEMDQALAFRAAANRDLPDEDRLTINDLLVRAAALALEEFPSLNGTYTEDGLRLNRTVDVAVAVAVPGGLLTPVVRDCGALGLLELSRELHRVVRAARKGRLKPEEYAGGTFTVSNLGMLGVESFSAVINPPQTAILAAGGTREEVVVTNGQFRPATVMRLTVAADHRVTDGVEVARFLNRIREILEQPWLLVSPHLRG